MKQEEEKKYKKLITTEYFPVEGIKPDIADKQIESKSTMLFHKHGEVQEEETEYFYPVYRKSCLKKFYNHNWDVVNEEYYQDDELVTDWSFLFEEKINEEPSAPKDICPPHSAVPEKEIYPPRVKNGRSTILNGLYSEKYGKYFFMEDYNSYEDVVEKEWRSETGQEIKRYKYENTYNYNSDIIKQVKYEYRYQYRRDDKQANNNDPTILTYVMERIFEYY